MSVDMDEQLQSQHRDRRVAAALAIFLGGFGAHHFYLGQRKQGATTLLFFWTVLPFFIGIDTGIHYLTMTDREFHRHVAAGSLSPAADTELDPEIQRGSLTRNEKWNEVRNTTLPDLLGESTAYRHVAVSALLYAVMFSVLSYVSHGSLSGMLSTLPTVSVTPEFIHPVIRNAVIAAIVSVFVARLLLTTELLSVSPEDIPRMALDSSVGVLFWGSLFVAATYVLLIPVYAAFSIPSAVRPAVSVILGVGLSTVWLVDRTHHTFPSGIYIRRHNARRAIGVATAALETAEDQLQNGALEKANASVREAQTTLDTLDERLDSGAVVGSRLAAQVDSTREQCSQLADQIDAAGVGVDGVDADATRSVSDEDAAVEKPDTDAGRTAIEDTDTEQTDTELSTENTAETPQNSELTVDRSQPAHSQAETSEATPVEATDQPSTAETQAEATTATGGPETATGTAVDAETADPSGQDENAVAVSTSDAAGVDEASTTAEQTTTAERTTTAEQTATTVEQQAAATAGQQTLTTTEQQAALSNDRQAARPAVPRDPPLSISDSQSVRKRISEHRETELRAAVDRHKESIAAAVDIEPEAVAVPVLDNGPLYATACGYERIATTLETIHRLQGTYPEFAWETFRTEFTRIITGETRVSRATLSMYHCVIRSADTVLAYARIVPDTHPSVEVDEWYAAVSTAIAEQNPLVLDPLVGRINRLEGEQWKRAHLYAMTRQELGAFVGELYRSFGYNVEVTNGTTDFGIDIWAELYDQWTAIKVKQRSKGDRVGRPTVQTLVSKMDSGNADKTIVVTTSGFTESAQQYADATWNITLVDGEALLEYLRDSEMPPIV